MPAPDKATEIKAVVSAILAFLTALWGWIGWAVIIWVFCFLLDYLSGTAAAHKNGEWSSDIAREGLWHKLGEIFALLVAILCDVAIMLILHTDAAEILHFSWSWRWYFSLMVSIWYIITELGSIIENADAMGANVPKWLTRGLAKLHDRTDDLDPLPDLPDKGDDVQN